MAPRDLPVPVCPGTAGAVQSGDLDPAIGIFDYTGDVEVEAVV